MAPRRQSKLTKEEILERKREAERRRYNRIKSDPNKRQELKEKEHLKYLKKKEKGTRKLVKDMTAREHRQVKKQWREHCARYRHKRKNLKDITNQFARKNTPDSDAERNTERQRIRQRQADDRSNDIRRKRRERSRKKTLKIKDTKIADLKKKVAKYKKRLSRLQKAKYANEPDTPNTLLNKMSDTPECRKELVKKALFGEVIKKQLQDNYSKMRTTKEKCALSEIVSGNLVKKYKLWRMKDTGIVTYKRVKKASTAPSQRQRRSDGLSDESRTQILKFYEDDSNSRLGAGKKEFITRKKNRKQKRYLLDSLINLYQKFKTNSHITLSYKTFCRLRPFWVVMPKVDDRDTCLCVTHANIDAKLSALYGAKILNYSTHQKLLQDICCDRYNEECLSRKCGLCIHKTPSFKEFNNNKPIIYKKWLTEKQTYNDEKTKRTRQITKYLKKEFTTKPRNLIDELLMDLEKFLHHERNIVHQYHAMKKLKNELTDEDAIVHMDFSENYSTKYGQEIQAFHFGGSRMQITLHTVVVYLKNVTKSYCTVSKNNSHSPAAIWTHLQKIFEALPRKIKHIHFFSDGPVTQYRNKTMFYILATKLSKRLPNIQQFSWNFSESGHGKGAPDGIGATCKRTADSVVATGGDIEDLDTFVRAVAQRCPAITIIVVEDDDIKKMTTEIEKEAKNTRTFKGTLQVHQITGNVYNQSKELRDRSMTITMRTLSCFCGNFDCKHFKIGTLNYQNKSKLSVGEVHTDSRSEVGVGPSSSITKPSKIRTLNYQNKSKLSVGEVHTDSRSEVGVGPSSSITKPSKIRTLNYQNKSKLCVEEVYTDSGSEGEAGPSSSIVQPFKIGDFVLVKFPVKDNEYCYAGVIDKIDEDEGDFTIRFLKICDNKAQLFRYDQSDIADVSIDQILKKLPVPSLHLKGNRIFYKFDVPINVFEKL